MLIISSWPSNDQRYFFRHSINVNKLHSFDTAEVIRWLSDALNNIRSSFPYCYSQIYTMKILILTLKPLKSNFVHRRLFAKPVSYHCTTSRRNVVFNPGSLPEDFLTGPLTRTCHVRFTWTFKVLQRPRAPRKLSCKPTCLLSYVSGVHLWTNKFQLALLY